MVELRVWFILVYEDGFVTRSVSADYMAAEQRTLVVKPNLFRVNSMAAAMVSTAYFMATVAVVWEQIFVRHHHTDQKELTPFCRKTSGDSIGVEDFNEHYGVAISRNVGFVVYSTVHDSENCIRIFRGSHVAVRIPHVSSSTIFNSTTNDYDMVVVVLHAIVNRMVYDGFRFSHVRVSGTVVGVVYRDVCRVVTMVDDVWSIFSSCK